MNIHSKLSLVIKEVEEYLSPDDIDQLKEYLDHNEFGLVVEHICTQLEEYEIKVSQELVEEIQEIGVSMGMDEKIWMDIHTL